MSKPNDNEDVCSELFSDEWHEQVQLVIQHTFRKLDQKRVKYDKIKTAKQIIDYNIEKTFFEALEHTCLPEAIDLSLATHLEAFEDFNRTIELFRLQSNVTHHVMKIYLGANIYAYKQLFLWEEWINAEQNGVEVTLNAVNDMEIECLLTK